MSRTITSVAPTPPPNTSAARKKLMQDGFGYEQVAERIRQAGDAGKRLAASGLSRKAVVVLIQSATGYPKTVIEGVLDALPKLPDWALKDWAGGKAKS